MSRPPHDRTSFGSNTYFVTASTWGHRSLFQTERIARSFIDTLYHYCCETKFLIHHFVVMPDHSHLLLTPTEIGIEKAMQFMKGGFSYRVRKELGMNWKIWERGYIEHSIRDGGDYARHVEYIFQNPVRAGLAARVEEYPYSSAHGGVDLDECPQGLKPQFSSVA